MRSPVGGSHDTRVPFRFIPVRPSASGGVERWTDALEIVGMLLIGHAYHLYYNLIGHLASLRGVDFGPLLATPLDRAWPYVPELVWFYQLAYLVPGIILGMLLWRMGPDVIALRRIFAGLLVLLSVHFALYLIFPTSASSVRLAPGDLGQGLSAELVRYQYRLATAWCACPSLHVSGCWYLYRVLARHYPLLHWIWLFWFGGMLLGTAGIKIHYVLDGVAGLLIAEAVYRGVLLRLEQRSACAWTWSSAAQFASVYGIVLAGLLLALPLLMHASGFDGPLYRLWR